MNRLLVIAIACAATAASAELRAAEESRGQRMFLGQWTNVDKENPGITRLEVKRGESGTTLQVWAKCSPEDCDWGVTTLHHVGDSVSDRDLLYGFATWDQRFKMAYMTLRIEKNILVAETYCIFTDDSGRSNYRSVQKLRRSR